MKRERKLRWWRDGTWWREREDWTDYLLYPIRFIRRIYMAYKTAFLIIRLEKRLKGNRELKAENKRLEDEFKTKCREWRQDKSL
jgi:hypothetical protein